MNHTIETNCPECNINHDVDFTLYNPEDGDREIEKVICKCGCEFEIKVNVVVEIDFDVYDPVVTKTGIKPPDFDIMNTETWVNVENPNQSKLF